MGAPNNGCPAHKPGTRLAGESLFITARLKFSSGDSDTRFEMNDTLSATTSMSSHKAAGLENEILTVLDVARFLRVPKSTVYKLARVGELPASKIGKHWRFLRRDIQDWVHNRSHQLTPG
jgi:excisionase family DNA binding protein